MGKGDKTTPTDCKDNRFTKEVARYFMDFLETDFKSRRIPKRNTIEKTQNGFNVCFDLEKYPELKKNLTSLLNSGFEKDSITISKGKYTNNVPASLVKLIVKKIKELPQENLGDVFKKIEDVLKNNALLFEKQYDKFLEESYIEIRKIFAKSFILPLLDDLDKPLENLKLADENAKYQLETDISDSLFAMFENRYEEVLQSFFQKPQDINLVSALQKTITLEEIKERLIQFFEDFTINDAFYDIYQIYRNNKFIDKTEIYVYFYEIALGNEKFPVIYMPISIHRENDKFLLQFDKRVFVNTIAISFVVQESNKQLQKKDTLAGEFERILYLEKGEKFSTVIETIVRKIENFFELNRNIDIENSEFQKCVNLVVSLSNKSYFFLFDKSDEALINDYEEILNDKDDLLESFDSLLNEFIEENPKPFMEEVSDEWDDRDISQKLTIESPIPLNDEQKQVLLALQRPNCKFLILEGPPGTGKSHTITAIICKALLEEKSVLVLSDKKEALDVVEDKISDTLNKVRHEDDFQNPILRLGRSGNKFYKIVSGQTISKIRDHYRAYKHKKGDLVKLKEGILKNVKLNLDENIAFFRGIKMDDVKFYFENMDIEKKLTDREKVSFQTVSDYLNSQNFEINDLQEAKNVFTVTRGARKMFDEDISFQELNKFSFLEKISPLEAVKYLENYIHEIESFKRPLIGYLLEAENISNSTHRFKKVFPFFDVESPEKNLKLLKSVHRIYEFILSELEKEENFLEVIESLPQEKFERLEGIIEQIDIFLKSDNLQKYLRVIVVGEKLESKFQKQPEDIFFKSIYEVEDLVAAEMTHFLDKRIVEYVDNFASEANTLKSIISKKQKFPKKLFRNLKKAFPCILAGIRDYAEFIPLEKDLFDLIIIDEASQVSIAQALPALIRGKQIVILGDDKQFSNVKSNNASTVTNQQYKNKVQTVFMEECSAREDDFGWLTKVKENFDIKNSILQFTRFIRNYECLLKKHFRCYPEIISYSDKFFYGNNLQCMKIRGKGIEEVIKFDFIEHDGKLDETKNTNELEVNFIVEKLKKFKEKNIKQSLGIITPHREQVSMLLDKINGMPEKDFLFEKCKLKIMTFDTCQGEERDYIFYSMVATREKDRLNWIFLKDFSSRDDEAAGTVKAQRLNVGFSRAKETIHFVLSKPIEEFSGEIKNALLHYTSEIDETKRKIIGSTDKNSEMESKIQQHFYETKFFKDNKKDIEFIPQFELGKYLKQLDKTYEHPAYKVDFLLIFKKQKIVIEYDGFKEHFVNLDEVDESNYGSYMKEDDIYRQKVLEGYGYKFLRINRFNIGKDPMETLNNRLQNLVKKNSKNL
jgi:superfamily I DNA and/or RNA helicase/very-short-patch-repair endonuclease